MRSFSVLFDVCLNKRLRNRDVGGLRRRRAHNDVIVMSIVQYFSRDIQRT